jgi:hypothetical protein
MAVVDLQAGVGARMGKAGQEQDVIQPSLKHDQQGFTRDALLAFRPLEKEMELLLGHPIIAFQLLLLPELDPVAQDPSSASPVLAGRVSPALDRAFIRQAFVAFEKELGFFDPAQPADRFSVSRHL